MICITLTLYLPFATKWLIKKIDVQLGVRAKTTPLVIGPKGSKFDLVLHELYFSNRIGEEVKTADLREILETDPGLPIPLYIKVTARKKYPIVGTTIDYLSFRFLEIARGETLTLLGDCIVRARVGEDLKLKPGDKLISDPLNVFDIAGEYPLRMHVRGILAATDTVDDDAVFVDTKTAWIIAGTGHGHMDVRKAGDDVILNRTENSVSANASLLHFQEINQKNIDSFHFHADLDHLPITAIIVVPNGRKLLALLRGKYNSDSAVLKALLPFSVVQEMMGMVLKAKRHIDTNHVFVTVSTALFLLLVVLLSLRLRKKEMETIFLIGCSRGTIFWLQALELFIILPVSALIAGHASWLTTQFAEELILGIRL
ncbi:MAG: FtsX-like permease family protein [Thermodesulfobacteriota bacterium]|nr:FtsX-like permease family protein [Thermodesulfobacteriota bacterium]